jgi:hypothetical protein
VGSGRGQLRSKPRARYRCDADALLANSRRAIDPLATESFGAPFIVSQ